MENLIFCAVYDIEGTKKKKKITWKKMLEKNKCQNLNQHIIIYSCARFQSIWRTTDFGAKLVQKSLNRKKNWKHKWQKSEYNNVPFY